ncbi:MAG: hypothetical protein ACLPHP_08720 [Candidatus Sulfotelmatobacter sp.]
MKLAFVVILIAASVSAQDSAPTSPLSVCGPMSVKFQIKMDDTQSPNLAPEPGKALVYVIEDQQFKAAKDVIVRVGLDGAWVGATRGDSYLSFPVEPGEHHLCANIVSGLLSTGRRVSLFGLTTEAGGVYYFRARTTGGPSSVMNGNGLDDTISIDLDLVNPDEGKFLVAFSSRSVSNATSAKSEKGK